MLLRALTLLSIAALAFAWWLSGQHDAPPSFAAEEAAAIGAPEAAAARGAAVHRARADAVAAASTDAGDAPADLPAGYVWLRVEVRDALECVVAGAFVELHAHPSVAPFASAMTDEDGVCRVAVPDQRLHVRASHPDVGRSVLATVDDARAGAVQLMLGRPVVVRGWALDEHAAPLVGARVAVEGYVVAWQLEDRFVSAREVVVGPDGGFRFEALVGASAKATLYVDGEEVDVETVVAVEGAEVVLSAPRTFGVYVVARDRDGAIVDALCSVGVERDGVFADPRGWPYGAGESAPAERPTTGAPEPNLIAVASVGAYTVRVVHDGYEARVPITISRARPRQRVEVTLRDAATPPQPRGFVFGGEGEQAVHLDVVTGDGAAAEQPSFWWQLPTGGARPLVTTPVDGGHVGRILPADAPRALYVYDRATRTSATHVFAAGALPTRVRVVLLPGGDLEVVVLHRGRPARGVHVEATLAQFRQPLSVDERGMVRFEEFPGGRAMVRVLRGTEELAAREVVVVSGELRRETFLVDLSR